MKHFVVCATVLCLLAAVAAPSLQAQQQPTTYVMAIYYKCTQGTEARADALFKEHQVPLWKSEQAAGRISSFGWMKHVEGGEWRRLAYITAPDLDKLLDSRASAVKTMQSPEHAKAMSEFQTICATHDDYIWRAQASSRQITAVAAERSAFALSTYYVCNAHEAEADFIVKTAFAPVLGQRVKDKLIDSWTWQEHLLGGKYRRIMVLDGASEKDLLRNWMTLQEALEKANPDIARRFTQICDSHSDYIWEYVPN